MNGQLLDADGSIALIPIGEINDSLVKEFGSSLREFLESHELIVTKDLRETKNCKNVLLLISMGVTKRKELINTNKKLLLQKKSVMGLLSINNINLKT